MRKRLRILASNYGRAFGWNIERLGERVAVLSDCRAADMFWDSYHVEPVTADQDLLRCDDFWHGAEPLVFLNRELGRVAPFAFAENLAASSFSKTGRVLMRGLYVPIARRPLDGLLLWLRGTTRTLGLRNGAGGAP